MVYTFTPGKTTLIMWKIFTDITLKNYIKKYDIWLISVLRADTLRLTLSAYFEDPGEISETFFMGQKVEFPAKTLVRKGPMAGWDSRTSLIV